MWTATAAVMQRLPAEVRLVWLGRHLAATARPGVLRVATARATAALKAQVAARLGLRVKLRP